jgi:hypothetical protein
VKVLIDTNIIVDVALDREPVDNSVISMALASNFKDFKVKPAVRQGFKPLPQSESPLKED